MLFKEPEGWEKERKKKFKEESMIRGKRPYQTRREDGRNQVNASVPVSL